MITLEQIKRALLEGMDAETVDGIPLSDLEKVQKALGSEADADVERLSGFLFSEQFRAAVEADSIEDMRAAAVEYFAKGLKGDDPSDKKLRSLAKIAFGEDDEDEDEDKDDEYDEDDEDEDEDEDEDDEDSDDDDGEEGLKKAMFDQDEYDEYSYDGDEVCYVDVEDLVEPIAKAIGYRDRDLETQVAQLRADVKAMRKGLITVANLLENFAPVQKALAQYMGDQAIPAGRAPVIAARQTNIADFDVSDAEFEETIQKGLVSGLLTPEMAGTLRAHRGTPNMALHHQTWDTLLKSLEAHEQFRKNNSQT